MTAIRAARWRRRRIIFLLGPDPTMIKALLSFLRCLTLDGCSCCKQNIVRLGPNSGRMDGPSSFSSSPSPVGRSHI